MYLTVFVSVIWFTRKKRRHYSSSQLDDQSTSILIAAVRTSLIHSHTSKLFSSIYHVSFHTCTSLNFSKWWFQCRLKSPLCMLRRLVKLSVRMESRIKGPFGSKFITLSEKMMSILDEHIWRHPLLFRRAWSFIWQRPVSIASCLAVGLLLGIALVIILSLIPLYLSKRSVDPQSSGELFGSL